MGSSAAVVVVVAWLLACLVAASAVSVPLYAGDRTRSTRGFKNHALSTARGFGKRADPQLALDLSDNDGHPTVDDANSVPAEWFADELQRNAALARLVVGKFLDSDRDGELTAEELLRPLLTADIPQPRSLTRQLLQ